MAKQINKLKKARLDRIECENIFFFLFCFFFLTQLLKELLSFDV